MPSNRRAAFADFKRMIVWIILIGVLMVAGALWYLAQDGGLTIHMIIATVAGVFFSVLLGCGLFAAAFYSDKSGHDEEVTDATKSERKDT